MDKGKHKPREASEKVAMAVLEEARMVLPGIQALFGFQLIGALWARRQGRQLRRVKKPFGRTGQL